MLRRTHSFPVSLLAAASLAPGGMGAPARCGSGVTPVVMHLRDFVDLGNGAVTFCLLP